MKKIVGTTTLETAFKRFRNYLIKEIKNVEKHMEYGNYKAGYLASLKETLKMIDEVLK